MCSLPVSRCWSSARPDSPVIFLPINPVHSLSSDVCVYVSACVCVYLEERLKSSGSDRDSAHNNLSQKIIQLDLMLKVSIILSRCAKLAEIKSSSLSFKMALVLIRNKFAILCCWCPQMDCSVFGVSVDSAHIWWHLLEKLVGVFWVRSHKCKSIHGPMTWRLLFLYNWNFPLKQTQTTQKDNMYVFCLPCIQNHPDSSKHLSYW